MRVFARTRIQSFGLTGQFRDVEQLIKFYKNSSDDSVSASVSCLQTRKRVVAAVFVIER